MAKKHRALNTNVIVKDHHANDDRKVGVIIVQQYDMSRAEGFIEDIGSNAFEDFGANKPKVGDKVVFARYAGKELGAGSDGDTRRVLRDLDILCLIDESGE